MKLIRTESKEVVNLGDSLLYEGHPTERYTFVGFSPNGRFVKANRAGRTTLFHPDVFKCFINLELSINDMKMDGHNVMVDRDK